MTSNRIGNKSQFTFHRAASTIVRTTLVVVLAGAAISFALRPTYQCRAKVFMDPKINRHYAMDDENPISGLFSSPVDNIADQMEFMQSDKVVSDACKDADVPPDAVTMSIHLLPGTHVVEMVVESAVPTYAERFAKTLPSTYMRYVTGNRREDFANAYTFATTRLKEENDKLVESEINQEIVVAHDGKLASTMPYARKMRELQRDIDLHRGTVDMLIKSIEDLRLRSKMTHDPVLVISPAKHAVQISPGKGRYILNSAGLGLILGLFAAGMQVFLGPKRA